MTNGNRDTNTAAAKVTGGSCFAPMTEANVQPDSPIIKETDDLFEVKLIYSSTETVPALYANQLIVQHSPQEFLISFYQAFPLPVLDGGPEATRKKIQELGGIPAQCIARIAIPKERMPAVVEAFVTNFKMYQERLEKERTSKTNGQNEAKQ